MALVIRLRPQGRKNRPFYRIVAIDARTRRDGKYVESIGWYNPFETEDDKHLNIKADRLKHWLDMGAQMSDNVKALMQKTCPSIVKDYNEQLLARQAKLVEKRKARKKKKAELAA